MWAPNFIEIHPVVVETFHSNVKLMVVREEKPGNHQNHFDSSSEDHEFKKILPINLVDFQICDLLEALDEKSGITKSPSGDTYKV